MTGVEAIGFGFVESVSSPRLLVNIRSSSPAHQFVQDLSDRSDVQQKNVIEVQPVNR
jgi:hypothetical protein